MVKGWLEVLIDPLVLAALLGAAGAVCRWRRRPRLGLFLVVSAAVVAYFGASPILGDALIGPLEKVYPPLREGTPIPPPGYIVVLGAGYTPRGGIPVTAALNEAGLVRVVEAIRLMRSLGIGKLVLSGGAPSGFGRSALGYAELARALGVQDSSLVILDEPQNTAAEARAVRDKLGGASFILVTSAAHMPRAVWLMRRVGTHPIPAPTGQLVSPFQWSKLFPNSGGLHKVEAALHEYLGFAVVAAGFE